MGNNEIPQAILNKMTGDEIWSMKQKQKERARKRSPPPPRPKGRRFVSQYGNMRMVTYIE